MERSEFFKRALASYERDKTTGMLKADDGSTLYFLNGQEVGRSEFDAASGLAHLSAIGFPEPDAAPTAREPYELACLQQAVEPIPAWFSSLAMTVVDTLPPVVMIGRARCGKTRLSGVLRHEVLKHDIRASIREYQSVREAEQANAVGSAFVFRPDQVPARPNAVHITLKETHLIAFQQRSFEDAVLISEALNGRMTPDEMYSLPRWHAVIRLAGKDSVAVVDTKVLYQDQ